MCFIRVYVVVSASQRSTQMVVSDAESSIDQKVFGGGREGLGE